jgi:2-keto-3-deoxy-L-fuconate dehydrogenase
MCWTCAIRRPISGLAQRVGPVDVLFNCAGMVPGGTVLSVEPDKWQAAFDLNVHAMFHMIRAFLPGMVEARNGLHHQHVVGGELDHRRAGSLRLRHHQGRGHRAHEVRRGGFRGTGNPLNAICPGHRGHALAAGAITRLRRLREDARRFEARQPMGRLGKPEEIAALACISRATSRFHHRPDPHHRRRLDDLKDIPNS